MTALLLCPFCASAPTTGAGALLALGAMIAVPYLIVALVVHAIRSEDSS